MTRRPLSSLAGNGLAGAALLMSCALFASAGAAAAVPAASHTDSRRHHRLISSLAGASSTTPAQLEHAARKATKADRKLVAQAQGLRRCARVNPTPPARCDTMRHGVQEAGMALAAAERDLASIAHGSGRARVSSAAGARARRAPVLAAFGAKLSWTRVDKIKTYVVVRKAPGLPDQYSLRGGTSYTPPAIPGITARYSVRAAVTGSDWARERSISYPRVHVSAVASPAESPAPAPVGRPSVPAARAPAGADGAQAAPQIVVSGQKLSWNGVAKVSTYVLVRRAAGVSDRYTEVSGTSTTPPPIAGVTAHYSVRTAIDGSSWAPEVAISYGSPPSQSAPTPPPPPPAPAAESPALVSSMWVGVDAGGWGVSAAPDVAGAVSNVRLQNASNVAAWGAAGVKVINDMAGPYSSGGVSTINAAEWAAKAVAWYRANPATAAIEVLNEPGNSAFWGSGAGSATNAAAYASLLKAVHEAFVANFGSARPLLLASYDGGEGPTTWGEETFAADPNVGSYIDGITMHSYGGTSSLSASALGSRYHIEAAHAQHPGIPIYVTEVGWPTAVGQSPTGDSLQWSEPQQAANITDFVTWAKGTGYIADVTIFNYRDYGSNDWYGIESASGAHKQSYAALAAFPH